MYAYTDLDNFCLDAVLECMACLEACPYASRLQSHALEICTGPKLLVHPSKVSSLSPVHGHKERVKFGWSQVALYINVLSLSRTCSIQGAAQTNDQRKTRAIQYVETLLSNYATRRIPHP